VAFGYSPPVKIFAIKQQGIEPKPVLSASTNLEANVVMVQWARLLRREARCHPRRAGNV
jgi:hypothetical protein